MQLDQVLELIEKLKQDTLIDASVVMNTRWMHHPQINIRRKGIKVYRLYLNQNSSEEYLNFVLLHLIIFLDYQMQDPPDWDQLMKECEFVKSETRDRESMKQCLLLLLEVIHKIQEHKRTDRLLQALLQRLEFFVDPGYELIQLFSNHDGDLLKVLQHLNKIDPDLLTRFQLQPIKMLLLLMDSLDFDHVVLMDMILETPEWMDYLIECLSHIQTLDQVIETMETEDTDYKQSLLATLEDLIKLSNSKRLRDAFTVALN
ncbi:hypothetical protein EDD86DRAFT_250554 [Gorgonomyces haynaldii]|nr:hypothetical protein EDD86DRAFT_250554 [Gorgonomyces haynaldii]